METKLRQLAENAAPITAFLWLAFFAFGCSNSSGGPMQGQTIDPRRPIYISPIEDATDTDGERVAGSGAAASAAFLEAARQRKLTIITQSIGFSYVLTTT